VIGVTEAVIGSNANVLLAMCLRANDVQIGGGLKDVSLTIRVRVNRDFSAHLDEFDVKHTGSLSVGFENLGSYDFLADTVSEANFTEFVPKNNACGLTDIKLLNHWLI